MTNHGHYRMNGVRIRRLNLAKPSRFLDHIQVGHRKIALELTIQGNNDFADNPIVRADRRLLTGLHLHAGGDEEGAEDFFKQVKSIFPNYDPVTRMPLNNYQYDEPENSQDPLGGTKREFLRQYQGQNIHSILGRYFPRSQAAA